MREIVEAMTSGFWKWRGKRTMGDHHRVSVTIHLSTAPHAPAYTHQT